jgi:cytoskeleton protein RodZ
MESVASYLKSAREKQNISLAQMAADTKISQHYLESLEEGRYMDLPGGMYNRAFLRAYCERFNLNQQEVLNRYEAEISPPLDRLMKSKVHIPKEDRSLNLSPVLIWSFMLLISATGLFFSRKWIADVFSPYFSRKSIVAPSEIAKPPTPAASVQVPPQVASPPATPDASPDSGSADSAVSDNALPANSLTPSSSSEPKVSDFTISNSGAPLRLEIGISEKCWVSIDRDGSPAVRRLMEPGDIQSVEAKEQVFLIVGNAGGVRLKINGKPAKNLGRSGEVVRILINEKNLQDLLDQTAG